MRRCATLREVAPFGDISQGVNHIAEATRLASDSTRKVKEASQALVA